MPLPVEILNTSLRRGPFRAVLFDFDGTLSLIREGWPRIMVGMMVEILRSQQLAEEPDEELWGIIERFVMALNGHPTVVQMARFAEEVKARGGNPDAPATYLQDYIDRLMTIVRQRWDLLESGRVEPAAWVVPNAHAILRNLESRKIPLFLASGTDLDSVRHEGSLLQVLSYFGDEVNAPVGGDPSFSKGQVIERILTTLGIRGDELLGFGDGVVETTEIKRAGGVAIGIASAEPGLTGVNPEKRARLAAAGADVIVPDYTMQDALIPWLWGEE